MTDGGGRVSLGTSVPSAPSAGALEAVRSAVPAADVAVVDLHDYDGASAFHEPFLRAADTVFMNDDRTDDPWELMRLCLDRGPRLAVCTRGAEGPVALDPDGTRHEVAAVPVNVVDTNGAGDAFMAGFLPATLHGAPVADALQAAAEQARTAIEGEHLHPVLGR